MPWLLYRSFFALPSSIKGADGRPVNALLGTVNALLAVSEACSPRAVVACTGAEEAAYRVRAYPRYHAHRDPMPEELAAQWKLAPALLGEFGWTVGTSNDLEADDVMYSFALAERERGGEALLLSGDRDMYAAVGDGIGIVELGKAASVSTIGAAEVRERYGVEPEQVADFIALRGDPSDGIPGAPGIGAKTAAELLREHGALEGALAAAHASVESPSVRSPAMRPRTARALLESAELLRTFREIATLQRIEVEPPADAPTDFERGARAASELGMRRLAQRAREAAAAQP